MLAQKQRFRSRWKSPEKMEQVHAISLLDSVVFYEAKVR
jgi:hypothetical protein